MINRIWGLERIWEMSELKQIKTTTLRDYIHEEMAELHSDVGCELNKSPITVMNNLTDIMHKTSMLIALQEIAYRLEYGYIIEIGNTSLKEHLTKPY